MNKRFDNFDYLKIIGSVLIVFYHYQMAYQAKFADPLVFYGGAVNLAYAAELFFVISGFLTAVRKNNKRFISAMLVKWIRIYPVAFLSVLVSLLSLLLRMLFTSLPLPDYSPGCILASILLVHQGWVITYDYAINIPTWYLCVLLVCYLIYYLIDALDRRFSLGIARHFMYIAIIFLAIMLHDYELPFFKLKSCRGYLAFFAGVIICELFKVVRSRRLTVCGIVLTISGIALIFFSRVSFFWEPLAAVIMYSGMVMFLGSIKQLPSLTAKRLADSSFALYVFHVPMIELTNMIVYICNISYIRSVVSMIVFLIFVEILAVFINRYVEIPLGRKLTKMLDKHKLIKYYEDRPV